MLKTALLFLLTTASATAQVITTLAGTSWLPPASGISALNAGLGGPSGVAVDGAGNIFIADSAVHVVERISPSGVLTIVAGNGKGAFAGDGGPAVNASLNRPWSVAVDPAGNVYIADSGNNRIRKVSNGIITTIAGNGAAAFAGDNGPALAAAFDSPLGVALDSSGNLYVADTGNNRIRKIAGGTVTTVAGNGAYAFGGDGGSATAASIANPEGLALDSAGNIYIADSYNCRIRKVTNGIITTIAGSANYGYAGDNGPATSAALYVPLAVTVDSFNNIYIADTGNFVIRKVSGGIISTYAGNPSQSALGDGGAATNASIDNVDGLATDANGNLYLAQFYEGRIRKVSGGIISTTAGNGLGGYAGDGGPAAAALIDYPTRAALDSSGNLYIADTLNNRVRKVSGGVITTVAGNGVAGYSGDGGLATNASLNRPWGVAVDAAGNLYIADNENQRVRKVSSGVITTIAGNGRQGYSGDKGSAVSASLSNPIGVAVDANNNVYIADGSNSVIRKVTGGVITTIAGNGSAAYSGDGGPAVNASLNGPYDVAVDSAGNLYIADSGNNVIRRVSGTTITTVAGNGAAGFSGDNGAAAAAELNDPTGVAVDTRGNVFIADTMNQRIREVAGGRIATVAGNGTQFYAGDGGVATNAPIDFPQGVALDAAGNLYIADSANDRVRAVLSAPAAIQASPASLSFTAVSGGAVSPTQDVTLSSSTAGLAFAVNASVSWIVVSTNTGAAPAVVQISVDPTLLPAGNATGSVTISAPNAVPSSISIAISAAVSAAAPPKLNVSTPAVTFTASQGSSAVTQTLQVLNTGGGALSFTASLTGAASWLSLSAQSGSTTSANPASLTLTANPGSLTPGTYTASISVAAGGSTINVPVTLSISPPTGTLLISQSALTFNAVSQGGSPLPQSFSILNTGQGSLNWTASATTLSGGNWLQLSSTSGTVARPFLDASTLNATVNPAGLSPGMYYARVQIVSTGAVNSPQSLTVILTVLTAGMKLGPQVYPTGLIFTGSAGASPGSQDVTIANTSSAANSYLSSAIGPLSFLPTNAVVQPSQPATLHVYPDFTNLVAGITRGTITLQFSDGSPAQTVNVLMSVAPADATSSDAASARSSAGKVKLEPRASCSQSLNVVFRLPQPSLNFTAIVGQSITLEAAVSDSCGNSIVPAGSQQQQIVAVFSNGDPQQTMSYAGNGIWQASWRPVTAAAQVIATVDAAVVTNGAVAVGKGSVNGAVVPPSAAGATPLITAQGVVHAASDAGGIPIAPGELITIFGANLASGSSSASGLPLPVSSNGTQIFLGAQPLPILYTSSGQMNVQVPYSAPVNTTFQLSVQNGSTLSVPQALTVAQAQPGIFTTNEQGFGQGAIVKSDGITLAQPGTPAAIGETVVIYCTGLGATTPAVTEGQPAPSTPPLASTANPTTVVIGGQPAHVAFSGLTPGFAGLYQVNAVVPSGIATGDAVPVTVAVGGQTSQSGVTMSVH